MSDRRKYAEIMFENGYVCSQAIFATFAPELGVDKEIALKIANGFGGGIARKQEVCGAVTGAIMVIGLKYGKIYIDDNDSHENTYIKIEHFCNEFVIRNKSINCYEILGCDLKSAKEKELFKTICKKCINDAVEITENILNIKE